MPIVSAVCTGCGATIQVDNAQDAAICPNCHNPFVVQKAIERYNSIYYGQSGNAPTPNTEAAMRDLYNRARNLLLNGACVSEYSNDIMSMEDSALQVLIVKILGIDPLDERMNIIKVVNAINMRLRGKIGFNREDVLAYLPLLRAKEPEIYFTLLNKLNQRDHKMANINKHYSGGLLGLKVLGYNYRDSIDRFLVPEEGFDLPYIIDAYYCHFWRNPTGDPDHGYVAQRLYSVLPPDWQRWFVAEFERRTRIERDLLEAFNSGNYRLFLDIVNKQKPIYPSLGELEKHFIKKGFSYKTKLTTIPSAKGLQNYLPDKIHDELSNCPSLVKQIENL